MNGFEPLRRRIIDYTVAGQWSEVYDGPLEDCESEKLKAENERLRELIYDIIVDEERGHNDDRTFFEHVIRAHEYGIAQDVEVNA